MRSLGVLASTWVLAFIILQLANTAEIKKEPTYLVVAPTKVRPNMDMKISASILKMEYDSFTVTAVVRRLLENNNYDEISSTQHTFTRVGTYDLTMRTRETMSPGNYTLRVAGYSDAELEGQIFSNDTELFFDTKQVSVFIQLSKPFYRQGQTVRLRVIPVQTNLKPVSTTMDVVIKDANGYPVREFFSQHTNAGGVVSLSYPLSSNLLSYGDWTVEVFCREHTYNKTFRVEEFYAPLFYVNVSMPTTMLRNSYGISGLVASNHTTGRGVKGNCTVLLEILTRDNNPAQPAAPLKREIPFFDSRTDFLFTREEMEAVAGGPSALIGKELRITGMVMDWFYNTTALGYQSAVVIDEDVEIKFLGGSVWSYKPDVPFQIYIAAVMRDGSPLDPFNENRTINLDIIETDDLTGDKSRSDTVEISTDTSIAEYWLDPKPTTSRISITARYRNKQDTRRELIATRFWSPNDYYIQLSTPTKKPTVGQYMIFNVKTNTFIESILYHIVAHGNIIVSDSLKMYSRNKLFSVALSREMAPSARIIAYFIAPDGQVVVDSLNFHVNGTQLHEMTLKFNRGKDFTYQSVEISSTADPLSYVAFSAIEYQLYELGARNGLTWEEVYQELYTYDDHANTSIRHNWYKNGQVDSGFYAPTPSYAHDANSTFFFAGLYVYTDANASAVYTNCNKTEGEYPCMDGITCYDFKEICTFRPECSADHRDEMGCFGNETYNVKLYNDDALWRTKHIGSFYMDGGFMWQDQFTKPDGRIDFKVDTPTFPTTWVVSGFSMSSEKGLAILPVPARYDGVRPMYITIQGPNFAKVGEHISLRISVFNFWDESMDVLIELPGSEDYQFVELNFDSASENPVTLVDGTHQMLVPVFPGSNRQVYLPLEPKKSGHLEIPIIATCLVGGQRVHHHVYIDNYGVKEHWVTNKQVDLTTANSEFLPDLAIITPEYLVNPENRLQNYVPNSPVSRIYVLGDIVGLSFFPYTDFDLNSENLLGQPYGTGAETLFNFGINLQTLKTLRTLSTITSEQTNKVVYTLNIAMQEMMYYMQEDGSFIEFRWSEHPSTWLTATALQILTEDKERISDLFQKFQIPPVAVAKAALWLSQQQDKNSGAFMETNDIYNRRFKSTIKVNVTTTLPNGLTQIVERPANMSLTALCVIALSQATGLSKEANEAAAAASSLGAGYLSRHVDRVQDPFELSITTYALVIKNNDKKITTLNRLNAMKRNTGGMNYWSTHDIAPIKEGTSNQDTIIRLRQKEYSNVTAYAVSATSYALLSNMNVNYDEREATSMQKFLQEQHMWIGGFASTMDTLVAVRALSKLAEKNQDRVTYEMTFTFASDQNDTWREQFTIDQSNWFEQKVIDLPSHWGSIQTVVKGVGKALIQLETTSNHEHRDQLRTAPGPAAFSLGSYNDGITTRGFNHSMIDYKICPSWLRGGSSGMSALEVGIPSGYVVHNFTLQTYVRQERVGNSSLRNAESYNDKAVFYFEYLDATTDTNCAQFTAIRWFPVANISEQHSIKVFEYYEPGNFFYSFYEKIELKKLTVCLTCGSYQCPYCPHFASGTWVTPNVSVMIFALVATILVNSNNINFDMNVAGIANAIKTWNWR